MKKSQCYSPINPPNYKGQTFTQKSQCVPDESLSVREIMKRYVRGEALGGKDAIYHEDEDVPQEGKRIQNMDLVDIQERILESKTIIDQYQKDLNSAQTAKDKKAIKEQIDAEVAKQLKIRQLEIQSEPEGQ